MELRLYGVLGARRCFFGVASSTAFLGVENGTSSTRGASTGRPAFTNRSSFRDAALPKLKCFPWIEVDGVVESKDFNHGCFGRNAATTPLLPLLCAAAGKTPPAACSGGGWGEWLLQQLRLR